LQKGGILINISLSYLFSKPKSKNFPIFHIGKELKRLKFAVRYYYLYNKKENEN